MNVSFTTFSAWVQATFRVGAAFKVINTNNVPGTLLAKQVVECNVLKGFQTIVVPNPRFRHGSLEERRRSTGAVWEGALSGASSVTSVLLYLWALSKYVLSMVSNDKRKAWNALQTRPNFMYIWLPRHLIKMLFQLITSAVKPEILHF